jgi:hypothetical protein
LSTSAGDTDNPYLKELIFSSSRLQVLIYAQGSPFESKDLLRLQGYRWNAQLRTWFRIAYQDNLESEIKWLEEKIYLGNLEDKPNQSHSIELLCSMNNSFMKNPIIHLARRIVVK